MHRADKSLASIFLAAAFVIGSAIAPANAATARKAGLKESPKKPVTVTSDEMEATQNKNLVVFKGNVAAVEDFTLCSDVLYVYYDANKEVKDIVAEGNVRVFQGEKTSKSDRAVYNRTGRTIVLTGSPQVKQCSDVVKGEKITVNVDDDTAFVESGGGGRVRAVLMPDKNCAGQAQAAEKGISEEARCKRSR